MARRRNARPLAGLLDAVALLPWWVGIVLALLSYLVLHQIAGQPAVVAVQPGQMSAVLTQSILRGFATAGQYAVPVICLGGAIVSAWRRRERTRLVASATESKAAGVLDGMTWQQFEQLVGEAFRIQGFRVTETGGGGADGGVDLALQRAGERYLVQCKQWRAFKVGVDVVRELYGVMAAKGAAGGFVVTSGRFTDEARSFADGRNIKLIDGPQLHGLIQQGKGGLRERTAVTEVAHEATTSSGALPSCPACQKPMVKRTAKRGISAGNAFWGCSGYPACKGTRQWADEGSGGWGRPTEPRTSECATPLAR